MISLDVVRPDANAAEVSAYPLAWAWLTRLLCDPWTQSTQTIVRKMAQGERLTFTRPTRVTVEGSGSAGMIPVGTVIPCADGLAPYAKVWEWVEPDANLAYTATSGIDTGELDEDSEQFALLVAALNWALDYILRLDPSERGIEQTSIEGFSESLGDAGSLGAFGDLLNSLLGAWGACTPDGAADGYLAFSDEDGRMGYAWHAWPFPVLYPRTRA